MASKCGSNSDSADQSLLDNNNRLEEENDDDSEYAYDYSDVEMEQEDSPVNVDNNKSFNKDDLDDRNTSSASTRDIIIGDIHEYSMAIEQDVQVMTLDRFFAICRGRLHSINDYHNAERYLRRYPNAARALSNDGMHPMHLACLNDAPFSLISALFEAWPNALRVRGRSGSLPLHEACKCGKSLATIQFLMEVWPESVQEYRSENGHKRYPLYEALRNPNVSLEIIQHLVYQWSDSIKVRDEEDMVAIHWACQNCVSFAIIQFLVEQWPESIQINGYYGLPLHRTCARAQGEAIIVDYLIQLWPDSVKVRNRGRLPLHEACRRHSTKVDSITLPDDQLPLQLDRQKPASANVLQLLVEAWPDAVSVRDKSGFLPIHYLCKKDPSESKQPSLDDIKLLVQAAPETLEIPAPCGSLPLHFICSQETSSMEVIDYLVKMCPQALRVKDNKGRFPLQLICSHVMPPAFETMQVLVQGWPEAVSIKDKTGYLPLHYACKKATWKQSLDIISLLAQASPETLEIPAPFGGLPLHLACSGPIAPPEVIRHLMEMCPQTLRAKSDKGRLPLHIACLQQTLPEPRAIETLVNGWREAVWEKDEFGLLALHYVCQNDIQKQSQDIIELLVKGSPNTLEVSAPCGSLPLHFACTKPTASMAKVIGLLIKKCPLAVRCKDRKGRLPLHVACLQKMPPALETIQLLVQEWLESVQDSCLTSAITKCGNPHAIVDFSENGTANQPWKPLDLVCHLYSRVYSERPSDELVQLLTNDIPPLHFASMYIFNMSTVEYLVFRYRNDLMLYHNCMLPLHCACRAGRRLEILKWWLNKYPDAVAKTTTNTGDLPLHCYLSQTWTATRNEDPYLSIIKYLLRLHPAALRSVNHNRFLPFHVAAMSDSPLDVLYHLVRQGPDLLFGQSIFKINSLQSHDK